MTSRKQKKANQKNAKHSTGPKTPEGKVQIHANALRHGLTSKTVRVMPWESEAEYNAHRQEYFDFFEPQTPLEVDLVERLVINTWRIKRIEVLAAMAMAQSGMDDVGQYIEGVMSKLDRYEARITRNIKACKDELKELVTARLHLEAKQAARPSEPPKHATPPTPPRGSSQGVPSAPQKPSQAPSPTLVDIDQVLFNMPEDEVMAYLMQFLDSLEARQKGGSCQNGFELQTSQNRPVETGHPATPPQA